MLTFTAGQKQRYVGHGLLGRAAQAAAVHAGRQGVQVPEAAPAIHQVLLHGLLLPGLAETGADLAQSPGHGSCRGCPFLRNHLDGHRLPQIFIYPPLLLPIWQDAMLQHIGGEGVVLHA